MYGVYACVYAHSYTCVCGCTCVYMHVVTAFMFHSQLYLLGQRLPILPWFYVGTGNLNSGPHSYGASALFIDPYPQPWVCIFILEHLEYLKLKKLCIVLKSLIKYFLLRASYLLKKKNQLYFADCFNVSGKLSKKLPTAICILFY